MEIEPAIPGRSRAPIIVLGTQPTRFPLNRDDAGPDADMLAECAEFLVFRPSGVSVQPMLIFVTIFRRLVADCGRSVFAGLRVKALGWL
jgi:hypothetical protein